MKILTSILFAAIALSVSAVEYLTPMTATNGVVVKPSNFWTANSNQINAVVSHPESRKDGWRIGQQIYPASNGTNYWCDFGITNSAGFRTIYQTIVATNNVCFIGYTNAQAWDLLSLNIVASGASRTIIFPPSLPHLDTNGLTISGGAKSLSLADGHELRMTLQTNSACISILWYTPEQ